MGSVFTWGIVWLGLWTRRKHCSKKGNRQCIGMSYRVFQCINNGIWLIFGTVGLFWKKKIELFVGCPTPGGKLLWHLWLNFTPADFVETLGFAKRLILSTKKVESTIGKKKHVVVVTHKYWNIILNCLFSYIRKPIVFPVLLSLFSQIIPSSLADTWRQHDVLCQNFPFLKLL